MNYSSRESACWTIIFRPERRLRSRRLLELGASDREAAVFWPGGGVFQRSGAKMMRINGPIRKDRGVYPIAHGAPGEKTIDQRAKSGDPWGMSVQVTFMSVGTPSGESQLRKDLI